MAERRLFIIIQDILFFKRSKDRSGDFQDLAIVILAAVEMKALLFSALLSLLGEKDVAASRGQITGGYTGFCRYTEVGLQDVAESFGTYCVFTRYSKRAVPERRGRGQYLQPNPSRV